MKRTTRALVTALVTGSLALGLFSTLRDAEAQDEPRNAAAAATFEVYKDKAGEFRWRLRTQNRNVIAASGAGYAAKRDCLAAIESVKKNASAAPVEEMQEQPEGQPTK